MSEIIPVGTTVQLEPRVYNIAEMVLTPGTIWKGVPGKTIFVGVDNSHGAPTNHNWLLWINGDNVNLDGITLKGFTTFISKASGFNTNVKINNCDFVSACITFTSGLKDSAITNNGFTGTPPGGFGIYGYNYINLTIANNEFIDITAGLHIDAFGGSDNPLIEQNYFSGIRGGMGMELQTQGGSPGANHVIIQDNYYEKPNQAGKTYDQLKNFMAISAPFDKGVNVAIRRNTIIATERPDGIGVRIGIESGGGTNATDATVVEENFIIGSNHVISNADGDGPSYVNVRNNRISNYLQAPSADHPASGRVTVISGNGANTPLSWETSRGRPCRNKRYGAVVPPVIPPVDPCASVKAENEQLKAQLATANETISTQAARLGKFDKWYADGGSI